MGLTKAERYNRMAERVYEGVRRIDSKAKCPRCHKSINVERGLGTVIKTCVHCGYTKFEGRN